MSVVDPADDARPAAPVADLAVLEPGSHLCGLYADDAQLRGMAAAFVGAGLAAGDQVLYVAGNRAPEAVQAGLVATGSPRACPWTVASWCCAASRTSTALRAR